MQLKKRYNDIIGKKMKKKKNWRKMVVDKKKNRQKSLVGKEKIDKKY